MMLFSTISPSRAILLLSLISSVIPKTIPPSLQFEKRDQQITFTIYNNCDEAFQPIFQPSLPGYQLTSQHVIQPNGYETIQFTSSNYKGFLYAPIKGSQSDGTKCTTQGQFDIQQGTYEINLQHGFNVGIYLQLQGKQSPGPQGSTQCDAAKCDSKNCKDANKQHQCPPDFTNWFVYFCPSKKQMQSNQPLNDF